MIFSEREKAILSVLLKNREALSMKDISKLTKIKERTLYREMKNLEISLSSSNVTLLKEKSKYKLSGDLENFDLSILDGDFFEQAYSGETRLNLILCFLILNKQTSIKDISEQLMLSYNTVASTVDTIEKILADYKLTLSRKKGLGISLERNENDKRILLISILCNEIDDGEFFSRLNSEKVYSTNPFIKFLNFNFLKKIYNENRNLEVFTLYTDSSIKKILISLNVIFMRLDYQTNDMENYTSKEEKYVMNLLETAKNYIDFDITNSVKTFMLKILKTCRLIEQLSYFNDKYSYTLVYKVNTLIKNVSKKLGVDFTKDTNLSSGLIAHVESAIKRYQMKLKEDNEDLQDFVLKNYNELYLIIKSEILSVFDEINFNSTELSYIVIHFASSYEQIYRKNFIRALVICASGIGSSKILGSQIRKNIPEIKNLEYTIPSKISNTLIENYDVVVSTIKLEEDFDYLLIPTILKDKDIVAIREKILNSRSFKRKNLEVRKNNIDINIYVENIEKILMRSNINTISNTTKTLEKLLISSLEQNELNIKDKEKIINNLLDRHSKSSVVIPKTNLALFHTLDNNLTEPFIIVSYLENSIEMINVDNEREQVDIFFTMVSPNDEIYTELLGQISIAILNDKIFNEAIRSKNKQFLLTKLELIMKDYILKEK